MRVITPSAGRVVVLLVGLASLLSACGGSDQGAEEAETTVTSTTTTAVSSSTAAPTPVTRVIGAVTKTLGISYADHGVLDVFAPRTPGPWPVVIVVHGGSQSNGNFAQISEAIATEGAVVYNIQGQMRSPFLTGIEQVACAVRFARFTAVDYGGDPARITLLGNSAGALTGVIVAMAGDDFETDRCVVTEGSALIDAVVGYEGPYDIAIRVYERHDLTTLEQEDPELWKAINTYTHIGGNPDLVVRLVHGRDTGSAWYDTLPEVSVELHDAMTEAGYDVGLTFVEDATHTALTYKSEAYEVAVELVLEVARD